MPSAMQGTQELPAPLPPSPESVTADPAATAASQLALASRALWSATLALMTAFMQTPAPAHRYLLAHRIARNFATLSRQPCFDGRSRASFKRLARRWEATTGSLAPRQEAAPRGRGLLRFLI